MTDEQLDVLFQRFCRYDIEGAGYISKQDFFEKCLKIKRNMLGDALCELCDVRDSNEFLSFTDFVKIIATYSLFEPEDMLKFTFAIFDREKKGFIDKDEYKHFLCTLWEYKLTTNLRTALDYLEELDTGDGQYVFAEITKTYSKFPALFYPIFQLQVHMQRYSLGEEWWEQKKLDITYEIDKKRRIERAKRNKKIKEGERMDEIEGQDDALIKRMGIFYYITPWRRRQEREMMVKIAAVDAALEAEQKQMEAKAME